MGPPWSRSCPTRSDTGPTSGFCKSLRLLTLSNFPYLSDLLGELQTPAKCAGEWRAWTCRTGRTRTTARVLASLQVGQVGQVGQVPLWQRLTTCRRSDGGWTWSAPVGVRLDGIG